MDIVTEYAVVAPLRDGTDRTYVLVDPTDREEAESECAHFIAHRGKAWIITRTITTTDWAPVATHDFKVGDPVLKSGEPGWEFAGLDTTTPATIRGGLVKLKWVGSDRNMLAYGVDPANLTIDTAQTGEEVA